MGIFDDISNAFNPDKNGLSDSVKNTGNQLNKVFNPSENGVKDTFEVGFPKYFDKVGDGMTATFGKGGTLDTFIGAPSRTFFNDLGNNSDNFFNNTLPTGSNQFFSDIGNKTDTFINNALPTGTNNFLMDFGTKTNTDIFSTISSTPVPMVHTLGGVVKQEGVNQGVSIQTTNKGNNVSVTTKDNNVVPMVMAGGAILAFIMLSKK